MRDVRTRLAILFVLWGFIGAFFVISVQGCWGDAGASFPCGRDFPCNVPGDVCIDGVCTTPDAGTDASKGTEGGVNAVAKCGGECVFRALDGWHEPRAFSYGAIGAPKTWEKCPPLLSTLAFLGYADPLWAPAICDACKCKEATGKCSTLPEKIELRAAICNQPGSGLPLGGPSGWDGSCTNANAVAENAKCPAGSSTLCALSVAASPLGAPIDEACEPFLDSPPAPNAALPEIKWGFKAIGCHVPTCPDDGRGCIPTSVEQLPEGFQFCISREGIHDCQEPWKGDRFVVYEPTRSPDGYDDALEDSRACSACTCGPPGGSCLAYLRTFSDDACTKPVSDDPISSMGPQCSNVYPAGSAIGSAKITPPEYFPGTCAPSGGEPFGEVKPDDKRAVTICCATASK